MDGLSPAKVACLKAAVTLYSHTKDDQFLRLGKEISGRDLAFRYGKLAPEEVPKAIKVVRSLFRHNTTFSRANANAAVKACDSDFKTNIPASFYCHFLVSLGKEVKNALGLKLRDGELGCTFDNATFDQDAMDSIKTESERKIESEKQALGHFESLAHELAGQSGHTGPNVLTQICEMYTSRTRETLETLKSNYEALSQLFDGSINIIKGPDSKD
ncbi:hypothetical protein QBC37DRAFT_405838 [Rhypophila decipiens]|uniref:Uncharacterized protein n=1 Tax=Rhypophila decipiens TaxID=261697 RepID=A0AAN7B1V4_9PEZI|nr:hypothetical protein QBC37DRAFT_405838 [Rhypophila decipiens]